MIGSGDWSKVRAERGVLLEYTTSGVPLMFVFALGPATLTRTRRLRMGSTGVPGTEGGYDFSDPGEGVRASQGLSIEAESIELTVLLDATDRMAEGDPVASNVGVQPEIDTLRAMLEPREHGPAGARRLAVALAGTGGSGEAGGARSLSNARHPALLIFKWGPHVLPVFMTQVRIEAQAHLPTLHPYRAEAQLTLRVVESENPIYELERGRQLRSAQSHLSLAGQLTDWHGF